ncbi:CBS domain-containing protein [Sporosarcina sp. CAU 1771]
MSTQNSDRFIMAYNRIEKSMDKESGLTGYMPFYRLIDKVKKNNAIVRKFEDDLREFADLRNAIVHNRTGVDYAIAEPHDNVVELIEYIDRKLSEPVTVGVLFQRKVHTLKVSDTLERGLELIRKKRFNKIPIYDNGKFIGLITAAGITFWLANTYSDGEVSRETTTLSDVYFHEKKEKAYRFIDKNLSVYEAEEYFKKSVVQGRRLEALLITENGQANEKLLGIITPLDLLRVE